MNSTKKPKLKLSNAARKRNSTTFQIFSKLRQYLNLCFVYIEADIFHGVGQFISRDKTVSVLNTRYQQQLPIQTFPKWYLTMSKTLNASRMSSSTHRSSYFLRMFADVYELPAKCQKKTMINFRKSFGPVSNTLSLNETCWQVFHPLSFDFSKNIPNSIWLVSEVGNFLPLDHSEEVWKDEGALVAGVHLLSHLLHGHHDQELHHSCDGDSVMVDMMLLLLVVVVMVVMVVVVMVVVVMVAVVMVVVVLVAMVVMLLTVMMMVGVMVTVQTTMRMTTTAIAATLGFSPICLNNLPRSWKSFTLHVQHVFRTLTFNGSHPLFSVSNSEKESWMFIFFKFLFVDRDMNQNVRNDWVGLSSKITWQSATCSGGRSFIFFILCLADSESCCKKLIFDFLGPRGPLLVR